jgi:GTPase SAR1 family protein
LKTIVINLFGGPGVGKSTVAAGLFHYLKLDGQEAELVQEFAKELTWMGDLETLKNNQKKVLREQDRRQAILINKVKYIITDSPLLLSKIYSSDEKVHKEAEKRFGLYLNLNFFLIRDKKYNPNGRNQTEEEARTICSRVKELLKDHICFEINGDCSAVDKIHGIVKYL